MAQSSFKVIDNEWIPLPDGRRLAARIWMPKRATEQPVPAILEYLPYRKRDGTAARDESTYPGFAEAGYAGVRVDIAGTGESDGVFDDEYSAQELNDACDVIAWIANQPWCNGKLGMMGISWGGFNSLQVAALQPPALKAIISIGSTVDRFNDDIHYKNGCQLYSNFAWSSVMLCFASRPPDPELVGTEWKKTWLQRLATQPFPLAIWLKHQRKNAYWKHGSVSENYAAIRTPTLIISGWADGYINAPPAAAANFKVTTRAVNGPWIHKYPHFAWPRPRMDFIAEALGWWDHWLKDVQNQVEALPAYRAYISENVRPQLRREQEPGRWVAQSTVPSRQQAREWFLAPNRQLLAVPAQPVDVSICSPQDCGVNCGEIFTLKPESELPGDQRADDAGSLVFDTEVLEQPVEILGRPKLGCKLSIDQTLGNIAVRLNDLHPDGTSTRVSWGVLNLSHRNGNQQPEAMTPGKTERVEIELDECGYRFLAGHRIRVAISTAYWPMIMPPPMVATATIKLGPETSISLPVRAGGDRIEVAEPEIADPLPSYTNHAPAQSRRWVEQDIQNGETHYHVSDDTGEDEMPGHGLRCRHYHEECWSITRDNPLTARATSRYICTMRRTNWSIRTVAQSEIHCDAENFYISATVSAFEGDQRVSQRKWQQTIRRDLM